MTFRPHEHGLRHFKLSKDYMQSQKKNTSLLLSVSSLATWGASLLAARLYWMGNKPPSFSNSDNPAADSHSLLTKTLTFFYLPSVNMWLLLCPDTLSFDWSMDAVPLLRNVGDWRNLHTVAFYVGLLLLSWVSLRSPSRVKKTNGKAYVVNGIHTGTNRKHTGTNGHSCHTNMGLPNSGSHTVKSTENGVKNHVIPRTSLPTTENVVVFSLGLLMVPFLPATNMFFYVGFVIAERVLYIPSMGFCLLVTVGMRALYIKIRRRFLKSLLLYCTATLVLLYGIKTVLRNQDWQDEEMLYKSGINVNPAKAWGNLGNVLKSHGKMAEAEQAYRNALYYRSNMADMLYNLGLLLQENSKFSEALLYYKLAIGSRPTLASAYLNTGIILMNEGRLDEAKRTFLMCAEIPDENLKDPHAHQSSVTSCLYNLGKLFYERGQIEGHKLEAEQYFLKAIQLDPTKGNCYMHYGQFLLEESRLLEAAEMAGKAAELDSTEFDVVFNAAHMLRPPLTKTSSVGKVGIEDLQIDALLSVGG
ncbi:Transmembrane and TPR repeat-containing protein 2 [Acipenser ruthenus]|uniref:dolichyl-phosphate-mannose--protein mannosyltransferase n=1 Tax=Acipenser ruthenus TaxID=7906 RepID=A0A662YVN0_ACIRT|nr:Transmembrane and TPR repeat-containing protein 2 [Acipenser ruthenus]